MNCKNIRPPNSNKLRVGRPPSSDMSDNPHIWKLYIDAVNYAKTYSYKECWCNNDNIYLRKREGELPVRILSKASLSELEEEDFLDVSPLPFEGGFKSQVKMIMNHVCLSEIELENVEHLRKDLTDALNEVWPGAEVITFGSTETGLAIKSSDVDCLILLPAIYHSGIIRAIVTAKNVLSEKSTFTNLSAITQARVPILKFFHVPTGFKCDINFSKTTSVRNSELIAFLLQLDERALHLAILIKYWSKVHHLTGTNLMTSYALTLMVVFYLQVKGVLPSVAALQQYTTSHWVTEWNTSFDLSYKQPKYYNNQSLYYLLGDFFDYYNNFDFEQMVISPYLGCPVRKKIFDDVHALPPEYNLYKHNVLTYKCDEIRMYTYICIQDPFVHNRNCTAAVSNKQLKLMQGHIAVALKMYHVRPHDYLLKGLLTQNNLVYRPELTESRQKLDEKEIADRLDKPFVNESMVHNAHTKRLDSLPKHPNITHTPANVRVESNQESSEQQVLKFCLILLWIWLFWYWQKS